MIARPSGLLLFGHDMTIKILLSRQEIISIRDMVMAYRDKVESEIENRIAYGGKYADPEMIYMNNQVKEANRLIKLLYRKETESSTGVKHEKKKAQTES